MTAPELHDAAHSIMIARIPQQGAPIRIVDQHTSAWSQHAEHLHECAANLIEILEHLTRHDRIEFAITEGQIGSFTNVKRDVIALGTAATCDRDGTVC